MNSEATIPKEIQDLTPAAFSQWKHHPVSVAYRLWLKECKALLVQQHLDRWLMGQALPDGGEIEACAKASLMQDLIDLDTLSIMRTYYPDHLLNHDGSLINEKEKP